MHIGQRIEKLMEKKNWTQKQLAEKVNMNTSVLNRIIKGTRPVRDDELAIFTTVLEVKSDYLLGKTNKLNDETDQHHPDESLFFFDEENITEEEMKALKEHLKYLRWKAEQENKKK